MRKEVEKFEYVVETNKLMRKEGLLLVAKGKDGKPNTMTIGWGFLGTMWSKPVFVVAVRKSRYTYKLMEESDSFTVCLPSKDMSNVLSVCGTKSGRNMDKFKELKLTAVKSKTIEAPYIKECPVHYECKVLYKDEMLPGELVKHIEDKIYATMDLHVIYYGEVTGTYTDKEQSLME